MDKIDKDIRHYAASKTIQFYEMDAPSARLAKNTLNRCDGVWAVVNKKQKDALVRMKQPLDDALLRDTLEKAGLHVRAIITG